MPSNFPTNLDSLTNPEPSDNLDTPSVLHTDQHANANDAIEALQEKVGIDGSSDTNSIDYKINNYFLRKDGTTPLTADWDAGSHEIRAETFESDVATGTAPLTVASTTLVSNLNADMVDGAHVGTSGSAIPLLNAANTWSGTQNFSGASTPGLSQTVSAANTSQVLSGGAAFEQTIALNKSTYRRGVIYLKRQTLTSLPRDFAVISISTSSNDAVGHSFHSSYNVSYHVAAGDSYLTHAIYSSLGGTADIQLTRAQIDGSNIELSWQNINASNRTLQVYITATVWE